MSVATTTRTDHARPLAGVFADLVVLGKLRIVVMELITVLAGFLLAAPADWHIGVLFAALVGTGLVAASASALNQVLEREQDAVMQRTRNRPIPAGRMSVLTAVIFATATGVAGAVIMGLALPWVATLLGVICWAIYVVAYTPLKTRTTWNTAVGAVSGALPIAIGWAAAGGEFTLTAVALFMVLVLWQYPHFMAIAWRCRDDYQLAGYVMSTTVDPSGRQAGWLAIGGSLLLMPVTLLPVVMADTSLGAALYIAANLAVSGAYIRASWGFAAAPGDATSRSLLRCSLLFLPLWLTSLLLLAL